MPVIFKPKRKSGVLTTANAPAPSNIPIPADRNFPWSLAGLMTKGGPSGAGIPNRTTIFTTLSPLGGGADDTSAIQTALNSCPAGQVVLLNSGTFTLASPQNPLIVSSSITLRGSGAGTTILAKGATVTPTTSPAQPRTGVLITGTSVFTPIIQSGLDNAPIILVGPGRFAGVDNHDSGSSAPGSTTNLVEDGAQGSYTVTVANGAIFTVGRFVLIDELSLAASTATPRGFLNNNTNGTEGTVTVLAGDRVVFNQHTPTQTFQDDPPDSFGWFSRPDPVNVATGSYTDGRLTCEIKEIAAINGNKITFTSPLTIAYRVNNVAQLTRYTSTGGTGNSVHLTMAGVESLTVKDSGGGGIFFNCAAYCWAKNVEVSNCFGLGIALSNSFRCEVRESYIHTSAQPTPAADSYAINLLNGSSECLIENNIMEDYCKVIAFRACGAGTVVGYNYTDNGWDFYGTGNTTTDAQNAAFQECGINASHMAGPHHVLFEGNYSFNADSDYTHGNSIYMTFFRNWITGTRTKFTGETGARCGGGAMFSYYMSYVGNVLGKSGQMTGWTYVDARMGCDGGGANCVGSPTSGWTNSLFWNDKSIWKIGYDPERWPCNPDTKTLSTLIRDGNWDFVTSSQQFHTNPSGFGVQVSMYLQSRPAFFGTNTWPWVDPVTGTTYTLPAKDRFDNNHPNTP